MPKVQWENKITMGNVLTVLAMVVALITGWQSLTARVDATETAIQRMLGTDNDMRVDVNRLRDQMVEEKLSIRQTLSDIKADLRVVRQALEPRREQNP